MRRSLWLLAVVALASCSSQISEPSAALAARPRADSPTGPGLSISFSWSCSGTTCTFTDTSEPANYRVLQWEAWLNAVNDNAGYRTQSSLSGPVNDVNPWTFTFPGLDAPCPAGAPPNTTCYYSVTLLKGTKSKSGQASNVIVLTP